MSPPPPGDAWRAQNPSSRDDRGKEGCVPMYSPIPSFSFFFYSGTYLLSPVFRQMNNQNVSAACYANKLQLDVNIKDQRLF